MWLKVKEFLEAGDGTASLRAVVKALKSDPHVHIPPANKLKWLRKQLRDCPFLFVVMKKVVLVGGAPTVDDDAHSHSGDGAAAEGTTIKPGLVRKLESLLRKQEGGRMPLKAMLAELAKTKNSRRKYGVPVKGMAWIRQALAVCPSITVDGDVAVLATAAAAAAAGGPGDGPREGSAAHGTIIKRVGDYLRQTGGSVRSKTAANTLRKKAAAIGMPETQRGLWLEGVLGKCDLLL